MYKRYVEKIALAEMTYSKILQNLGILLEYENQSNSPIIT